MKNTCLLLPLTLWSALCMPVSVSAGLQQDSLLSDVWVPDNGDGTYSNPVIHADYSDPDLIRVGDDFYLTASSFNSIPGLPILHSRDLIHWTIIGHALSQQLPVEYFQQPRHGEGVWAPALRYHNGEFRIYYGDPDRGIYLLRAAEARGPWSSPLLIEEAKGWIDPCPFWDENGDVYLVHAWAKSRAGFNSILTLRKMNADGTRIIGEGVTLFDGSLEHPTIEGPKMYRREGYYYVFAPAGGVKTGWQTVLRSRNIEGPYEARVVMHQGRTGVNGPHQGAWVELKSGQSWFMHFQDLDAYGRVVHLQPLTWREGWPVIGTDEDGNGIGEPVLKWKCPDLPGQRVKNNPQTSDEFSGGTLGLQWQWPVNPDSSWFEFRRERGVMRLYAQRHPPGARSLWDIPNICYQKFPAPEFCVTTELTIIPGRSAAKAGLVVMGTDYAAIAVTAERGGYLVSVSVCEGADGGKVERRTATIPISENNLVFRVTVRKGGLCSFAYSFDGEVFSPLGEPFMARAGKWVGARVGLFCSGEEDDSHDGYVDVNWFRFRRP